MKLPVQVVPALWGAAGGALLLTTLGFTWFGWVGPDTSETRAKERAEASLVRALTPICLDRFRAAPEAAAQLAALKKIQYSWEKGPFVLKAGWADFAASKGINSVVASACAAAIEEKGLIEPKPAAAQGMRPQGTSAD